LHPRWKFAFQPTCAAYRNRIEPWWKILRFPVLKGRWLRPGPKATRPSNTPSPAGTRAGIHSSGAAGDAIVSTAAVLKFTWI
jgi:hypothetical protein